MATRARSSKPETPPAPAIFIPPSPETKAPEIVTPPLASPPEDPWSMVTTAPIVRPTLPGLVSQVIPTSLALAFEAAFQEWNTEVVLSDGTIIPAKVAKEHHVSFNDPDMVEAFTGYVRTWAQRRKEGPVTAHVRSTNNTVAFAFSPRMSLNVKTTPPRLRKTASTASTAEIRQWALDNGREIADRGRIPESIREDFQKAQSAQAS